MPFTPLPAQSADTAPASRTAARLRRQLRGRKRIQGTAERPRLVVTRSSKHISVQVVDDLVGKTLAYASTMESDLRSFEGDKTAKARKVGELVAESRERGALGLDQDDRVGHAECVSPGARMTTLELVCDSTSALNASASVSIGGKVL